MLRGAVFDGSDAIIGTFRHAQVCMILGLVCGVTACLTVTWVMATRADVLVPLNTDELRESRGGLQNFNIGTFSCNDLTGGLSPCTQAGGTCTTCFMTSYTDTGSATGGHYDTGLPMTGACGDIYNGICDTNLTCEPKARGGDTGKACSAPPGQPTSQSQG